MSDREQFERKFEEWVLTHPLQTGYSGDLQDFISEQTIKLCRTTLEASNRIIVSQDRLANRIDESVLALRDISNGLEDLNALFEWGFSELIWQLEQQRETLKDILDILQAPLDTQAKELKKRAEEALKNGWIDDALQDFLESEKRNRYDFTIHQYIGNIYFGKKKPNEALEYYRKAEKYARPYSSYYASVSLLHIGLIRYLQGDFKKAYEATLEALKLHPRLYEAHYQHSQYCALLVRTDEALEHLKRAILGDRYYLAKAISEKNFDAIKERIRSLGRKLAAKARALATSEINRTQDSIHYAESLGVPRSVLRKAHEMLLEAEIFLARESLFDYWDTMSLAYRAQRKIENSSSQFLSEQIRKVEDNIRQQKDRISQEVVNRKATDRYIVSFVVFLLVAILTLSVGYNYSLSQRPYIPDWWWPIGTFILSVVLLIVPFTVANIFFSAFPSISTTYYRSKERRLTSKRLGLDESTLSKFKDSFSRIKNNMDARIQNPIVKTLELR